jgi:predicted MFS family arabinose efflux permease
MSAPDSGAVRASAPPPDTPLKGARWTLTLLTVIATVQFFDRALMVVILEPIKREFALADAQLGLLAGLSYAAAFALAGIPLGWLADRTNRRNLLAGLLAVWSAMVALAGSAGQFATLIAARIGIGAMDAGGQPCSVSMIADLYVPQRRATAVAVFYVGVPLGMAAGFMAGGLLAAHYGWRTALFVAAVPGIVLAALLLALVREPVRGASEGSSRAQLPPPSTEGHAGLHARAALARPPDGRFGAGHSRFVGHDVVDRLAADPQPRPVAVAGRAGHGHLHGRLRRRWARCSSACWPTAWAAATWPRSRG